MRTYRLPTDADVAAFAMALLTDEGFVGPHLAREALECVKRDPCLMHECEWGASVEKAMRDRPTPTDKSYAHTHARAHARTPSSEGELKEECS